MTYKSNLVEIEVQIVHETEKAWLFDIGKDEPVWIPKACGEYDGEGDLGILFIPEPMALEKGLI